MGVWLQLKKCLAPMREWRRWGAALEMKLHADNEQLSAWARATKKPPGAAVWANPAASSSSVASEPRPW